MFNGKERAMEHRQETFENCKWLCIENNNSNTLMNEIEKEKKELVLDR